MLEEHGHCEVPAGCGGVVLRWRGAGSPLPIVMHAHAPCPVEAFLDGAPLASGRFDIAPGRHVLGLALKSAEPTGLFVMAVLQLVPGVKFHASRQLEFSLATGADGSWRALVAPAPPGDWLSIDADDRGWTPLVAVDGPEPARGAPGALAHHHCKTGGAQRLGFAAPSARGAPVNVWIRKTFELTA